MHLEGARPYREKKKQEQSEAYQSGFVRVSYEHSSLPQKCAQLTLFCPNHHFASSKSVGTGLSSRGASKKTPWSKPWNIQASILTIVCHIYDKCNPPTIKESTSWKAPNGLFRRKTKRWILLLLPRFNSSLRDQNKMRTRANERKHSNVETRASRPWHLPHMYQSVSAEKITFQLLRFEWRTGREYPPSGRHDRRTTPISVFTHSEQGSRERNSSDTKRTRQKRALDAAFPVGLR